jgi:predicted DNA-binding transcriptional regulator AlpA
MSRELAATVVRNAIHEHYITEADLAALMRKSLRTIRRMAERRVGPPRITVGKTILYKTSAVEAWLEEHAVGRKSRSRRSQ